MTDTERNHAQENAKNWLESIVEMIDALDGYESAAEAEGWTGPHKDEFGATFYRCESDGATWACDDWEELCKAFDIEPGDDAKEEARRAIDESPLSVQVRSGWYSPGADESERSAAEYEILLSTGGPALRIIGDLSEHGEPESARLQYQDWGTPWTDHFPMPEGAADKLLAFASCFYFGE